MSRFLVTSVVCLVSCDFYEPTPPREPSLEYSVLVATQRMHERYAGALAMEDALARGDLDGARVYARVLDVLDEPAILAQWRPYLDDVRVAAHRVALAKSPDVAADATAAVGRACARCHEAMKAHVTFPATARPTIDRPRLATQMTAHHWAAVRMWEGLIGPSDDRWILGADGLTAMPSNILAQAVTSGRDDGDDIARIKLYATRALATPGQDARAELFGRILTTCAHCHAELRDR